MISYNFYNLFYSVDRLINSEESTQATRVDQCSIIAEELNKFFNDFKCLEVIYTLNTDKSFFGIFVRPYGADIKSILSYQPVPVSTYQVEIDSRLVTDFGLSAAQVATLMLLDINSIKGNNYAEKIINTLDAITAYSGNTFTVDQNNPDKIALFKLSCDIVARNLTSVFCKSKNYLCYAANIPNFINDYKLQEQYATAIEAIIARTVNTETEAEYPAIMMSWFSYINSNDDPGSGRYVKGMLRKALSYEASSLVRKAINATINTLDSYIPPIQSQYLQSLTEAKHGLISQMKRNGLRSLEDDLYEYTMRLRNVETQDEAILLMRQINSRMSILEDYLREEDIDEKERKRWQDCYDGYAEIRNSLSKKSVYSKKMYGLFVDYNALQNMSQSGQLNTYY